MKLAPIAQTDDALVDETIATNLMAVFNGFREAAQRLRADGRIVSFSTSVVGLALPTDGVYSATKAAVEMMTRILANEVAARGIRVNAIAPGPTGAELFVKGKDQAVIDRLKSLIPLGRLGEVEDIASVLSFLVGPDSGWINAQLVRVNGGMI
jgi:3-oxoacyl-[acyl-carrier protein] reductase